jgi:hypothetical protein
MCCNEYLLNFCICILSKIFKRNHTDSVQKQCLGCLWFVQMFPEGFRRWDVVSSEMFSRHYRHAVGEYMHVLPSCSCPCQHGFGVKLSLTVTKVCFFKDIIIMSTYHLFTSGSIHQVHERFSDFSWGRQCYFMSFSVILCAQAIPIKSSGGLPSESIRS